MPNIEDVTKFDNLPNDWANKLRIYFQEGIDVVVGKDLGSQKREIVENQKINQILAAAFDWRLSACGGMEDLDVLRKITKQMLSGFYEGTLLASALNGKHKIFLTVVGGGVFQNDRDVIVAAIANKRNLKIIKKYHLDVTLVMHYSGDQANYWRKSMRRFWKNKGVAFDFRML